MCDKPTAPKDNEEQAPGVDESGVDEPGGAEPKARPQLREDDELETLLRLLRQPPAD